MAYPKNAEERAEKIKKTKSKMKARREMRQRRFDPDEGRDLGGSGDDRIKKMKMTPMDLGDLKPMKKLSPYSSHKGVPGRPGPRDFDKIPEMKKKPAPRPKKKAAKKVKRVIPLLPKITKRKEAKAKADAVKSRMGKDIKSYYGGKAPTKKRIEEQKDDY